MKQKEASVIRQMTNTIKKKMCNPILRKKGHTKDGKDNKTCRATHINLELKASRLFQWYTKGFLSKDAENSAQLGLCTAQWNELYQSSLHWNRENHFVSWFYMKKEITCSTINPMNPVNIINIMNWRTTQPFCTGIAWLKIAILRW